MTTVTIPSRFTLFDTAFGHCALAWNAQALTAVRLPDHSAALTRAKLLARQRGALPEPEDTPAAASWPAFVTSAVKSIRAHLSGQAHDLRDLPLDFSGVQAFECRVYAAARALDAGQTCTYGELARAIGAPDAMRAVGQALGHNPWPIVVPCHRVLAAGGRLGGFSAPGGSETKRRLLLLERAMCHREGELF